MLSHFPFGMLTHFHANTHIALDDDQGVGDIGGNNKEHIIVNQVTHLKSLIIAANIYDYVFDEVSTTDTLSKYDGVVTVQTNTNQVIRVPLTSSQPGSWCIIAQFDAVGDKTRITNVNQVQDKPPYDEFADDLIYP